MSLAFLYWVGIAIHLWPFVSDIAIYVLKRDVKLQLTNFTHCKDIKEDSKRKNKGELGCLRSLKVISNVTFDRAHTTSCYYFVHVRDTTGCYLFKVAHFSHHTYYWNFSKIFGVRNLESLVVWWYKSLAILIQLRLVMVTDHSTYITNMSSCCENLGILLPDHVPCWWQMALSD